MELSRITAKTSKKIKNLKQIDKRLFFTFTFDKMCDIL